MGPNPAVCEPFSLNDWLEQVMAHAKACAHVRGLIDEETQAVTISLARSLEARDSNTEGHCDRSSAYAVRLGSEVGVSAAELRALKIAGIIHDVGKVTVPDCILLKPGPLDDEERRIIEQHPVIGEQICRPLKSLEMVLPIIRHHHERGNGTGYPDRLTESEIPLTAKILQTVDVYDALTMHRPYRRALSSEEAFRVMNAEVDRGWLDASLVRRFKWIVKDMQNEARLAKTSAPSFGQTR